MTTKEAFGRLVSERNWHKDIEGLNPNQARVLKTYFKNDTILVDTMEKILIKAGFTVEQEKLWKKN